MCDSKGALIGLMLVNLYFSDMKASTYPLLSIDCVPRAMLARAQAFNAIVVGLGGFFAVRYGARLVDYSEHLPYLIGGVVLAVTALLAAFRIQEPPIRNPTSERFTPFSTMKVAWRDRRIVVLMLAMAMLGTFGSLMATWLWFYAQQNLGLNRTQTGAAVAWSSLVMVAVSYPAGWLIDRFGSYLTLLICWGFVLASFLTATQVTDARGLSVLTILFAVTGPFYGAGSIILYKQALPEEMGSVTATASFVRNLYTGVIIFVSGYVIQWTGGHYLPVFGGGFALTSLSIVIFFWYRWMMKPSPVRSTAAVSAEYPMIAAK
jgi:Na+/melibiose symporter-like transporter